MAAKDIIVIAIVLFVAATFIFVMHFATSQILTGMSTSTAINQSSSANNAISNLRNVLKKYDMMVFVFFMGTALTLVITGWFVGGNPIFTFAYIIIMVIIVAFSPVLANAWESLTAPAIFASTVSEFPISDHLMRHIPVYSTIIACLGFLVMFAKPRFKGGAY